MEEQAVNTIWLQMIVDRHEFALVPVYSCSQTAHQMYEVLTEEEGTGDFFCWWQEVLSPVQRAAGSEGSHDVRSVAIKGWAICHSWFLKRGCWAGVQHLNPGCWPVWVVGFGPRWSSLQHLQPARFVCSHLHLLRRTKLFHRLLWQKILGLLFFPLSFGFAHGESIVVQCHFLVRMWRSPTRKRLIHAVPSAPPHPILV